MHWLTCFLISINTHTRIAVYLSLDSTDAENKRAPNVNESTAENSPRHTNSYLLLEKRSLTKLQWRAFKGNHGAFYFKRDCIFDLFQRFTFSRSNECTPGCLPETEYEQVQCLASGHSLAAAAGGVRRVSPSTFADQDLHLIRLFKSITELPVTCSSHSFLPLFCYCYGRVETAE